MERGRISFQNGGLLLGEVVGGGGGGEARYRCLAFRLLLLMLRSLFVIQLATTTSWIDG